MAPEELIADLRSRINPEYSDTKGTESYERRLCVEALEKLVAERNAFQNQCIGLKTMLAMIRIESADSSTHQDNVHSGCTCSGDK